MSDWDRVLVDPAPRLCSQIWRGTNPRVWLDIAVGGKPLGTVMFELFKDDLPRTCKNFVALCRGNKGVGLVSGAKLHLKGTRFHRVINNYIVQARRARSSASYHSSS